MLAILLLSIAAIVFTPTVVHAQTSKRLALVIGNDSYTQVSPLANSRNDARAMAAELKSAGFDVTSKLDVNYFDLIGLVGAFTQRIQPGDEVAVFFAGHGLQLKSGNFLLPVDIQGSSEAVVERTSLSLDDLMDQIKRAGPRFTLMVIDACRDNPFKGTGRNIGEGRGLRPPEPPKGQLVVFSASRGQQALDKLNPQDSNPNGVFTREFIKKMRDKGVPVDQVARQVQETVEQLAAQAGKEQRPAIYNESRGNFYFYVAPGGTVNINPPAAPVRVQSADEIEQQAWNDTKGTDTISAYEAYKAGYPNGRYVASANIAIARLKNAAPSAPAVANRPTPSPVTPPNANPIPISPGQTFRDCSDCPEMVMIPSGSFMMGAPTRETERTPDQSPQHLVNLKSVAFGKTPITRGQFAAFVNATNYVSSDGCFTVEGGKNQHRPGRNWRNPGFQQDDSHPVVCISWNDARSYTDWLSRKTGRIYRLPSESQWEYAARASTMTRYYWGEAIGNGNANCKGCGSQWDSQQTAPVGSFRPNAFGLYDMAGNVDQWLADCWNNNYDGAPSDGSAWTTGSCSHRVFRGGNWYDGPSTLRSAYRSGFGPGNTASGLGFRVLRTAD
jgi:formylglycine-generating enzyme required for sulfatase activity